MKKLTTDNLVMHGFPSTKDVYLVHGSNGVFLPSGGTEHFFSIWAPRPNVQKVSFLMMLLITC